MKVDKVGINVEFWKGKSFEEFEKAFKGKLRSDKIKEAYDKLPKVPKPIVLKKKDKEVKEVKKDK
jgi:hypothetical protein